MKILLTAVSLFSRKAFKGIEMKYYQEWQGRLINSDGTSEGFPASVPGNIQNDYAIFNNWGDLNYRTNCTKYAALEDLTWEYISYPQISYADGERVFFVSKGIDYSSSVTFNGVRLCEHEGMFSDIVIDITDYIKDSNELIVTVYPHPKRSNAFKNTRDEADIAVKPPVCYGWDWHPRLLFSGMWQEAYIETRKKGYIRDVAVKYELSDDFKRAMGSFEIDCDVDTKVEMFDENGKTVYKGDGKSFTLEAVNLWWCSGHGKPYLYSYKVVSEDHTYVGKIGFKRSRLIMAKGEWNKPNSYPMSRSNPPITLELNGKIVFVKGSNMPTPEIFPGTVTRERYNELLKAVKDANLNMLRMWGGCGIQKKDFYELCDEYGIMVWQEFPLACNCYGAYRKKDYCKVLKQEAISIIKRISKFASLVMWCGGNELFNNWSKMTEQSKPLRILDELTYEYSPEIPFIMATPLSGMKHGPYVFWSEGYGDVVTLFQSTYATAYTEFGCNSVSSPEYLSTFMDKSDLENPKPDFGGPWTLHHAFGMESDPDKKPFEAMCKRFKLPCSNLDEIYEATEWLQAEGLKFIFEEARRQSPTCSMAINWFFTEPWRVAVGFSLMLYPDVKKLSYHSVSDSCRSKLASARYRKFDWKAGEVFEADIWLLNDTREIISDEIEVKLEIAVTEKSLAIWKTGETNINTLGPTVHFVLPDVKADSFILKLVSKKGYSSEYKLKYYETEKKFKSAPVELNSAE